MSTGFNYWSNKDNNDLNIRAVRFGFKKPILETELNEMQDLMFLSNLNSNRGRENVYFSNLGSPLNWNYITSGNTTTANLNISPISGDVLRFVFSGGLDYYYNVSSNASTLISVSLSNNEEVGTVHTLVLKAELKTVSPDVADTEEYNEEVLYAKDSRNNIITTKRIMVCSGFNQTYTEVLDLSYNSVVSSHLADNVNNLIDISSTDNYVVCVLGSWEKRSDDWYPVFEIPKAVNTLEKSKYDAISDGVETFGTYTLTPYATSGVYDLRIDIPFKSTKYGYYVVYFDERYATRCYIGSSTSAVSKEGLAIPVNHPIHFTGYSAERFLNYSTIELYDLFDIVVDNEKWGDYLGQSWEDLLNQKWFSVGSDTSPSLRLTFGEPRELNGVIFGSLKIIR